MLPVSVFATGTCTCENRCYLNEIDANCTVCTNSDFSGCMGTPELVENGSPTRYAEAAAEVNFMATVNPNVTWKYFYMVTNDASAQPTASTLIAGGAWGDYSDPCTLVLYNLAEGEKYIHIVLNQEEQGRTTNVLRLTIPAFVKLTLTPSANVGNYDADTNTLTIEGGGTVNFTLNVGGYVHCDSDQSIEPTPVGDDPENTTEWTVTLPATPNTYTFYYGLSGQEAWCTVVVVEETHEHSFEYECSAKCSVCDFERLATHVYEGVPFDSNIHDLICKYCEVPYNSGVFPHEYDDDCDSVCDICGYERTGAHNYAWGKDAEGHEEKCADCGDVRVARAAHTSGGAATDDTPETCTVCGYEMAPKLESSLTIVYNNTAIGGVLASHPGRAKYTFATGTVVDLSDYWPDIREYTVDGQKYYFYNFVPDQLGGDLIYSVTLNNDVTVYAAWVMSSGYTVTFDATGGTAVPKQIIEDNLTFVNNLKPTRHGYEFLGWSVENDGTPDSFDNYRLTSDCTLYATWKQIHNISPDWSYDAEVHYRTCDCGERHDEQEHKFYITSKVCYKCGYVEGMAIGSTDKTSVEFVPVAGTTLPEGSYLDVKAYEVVEKDVETIFKATAADGVSNVTEIIPTSKGTINDDGWVFSNQYTLRMGDKVTIGGVTYIVTSYGNGTACLISNGEEYYLDKDKGLYKTGYRLDSYSTDTELISIDGVQYVITFRITSGDHETIYFTTTDGKAAGHYLVNNGEMSYARFYSDCTPEALTPKVSDGGVVAIADGQFLVNTSGGVMVANTVWANNISLHGANGLPVTGVSGTLTVSGIQYVATKSTIAAHIGAQGVDVGRFDDSIFDIRDVDNFSPFVLLEVADFEVPAIELTGVNVDDTPTTPEVPDSPQTGDNSHMWLWFGLMLASGFALAGTWLYGRKRRSN